MTPFLNGKFRLPRLWAYGGYSWWETKPVRSNPDEQTHMQAHPLPKQQCIHSSFVCSTCNRANTGPEIRLQEAQWGQDGEGCIRGKESPLTDLKRRVIVECVRERCERRDQAAGKCWRSSPQRRQRSSGNNEGRLVLLEAAWRKCGMSPETEGSFKG